MVLLIMQKRLIVSIKGNVRNTMYLDYDLIKQIIYRYY